VAERSITPPRALGHDSFMSFDKNIINESGTYKCMKTFVEPDFCLAHNLLKMQYLTNPFNYNNDEPKIHDNESLMTYGFKHTLSTPLFMPNSSNDEVAHIWLLPGSQIGVSVRGLADGTLITSSDDLTSTYHLMWPDPMIKFDAGMDPDDTSAPPLKLLFEPEHSIRQWRVVSSAVKLNVLNTADSNDGWFEAVRFTPMFSEISPGNPLDPAMKHTISNYVAVGPYQDPDLLSVQPTIELSQKPTYQTGRLRDLNDLVFMLQRNDTDCPWVTEIDREYPLNDLNASHVLKEFGTKLWDPSFDGIYIRIHGRKDPPSDQPSFCRGTRLLLEAVANHEYVFGQTHPWCRLMSKSVNRESLVRSILVKLQKYKTPGRTQSSLYNTTTVSRKNIKRTKKNYRKAKRSKTYCYSI
jgi:hypothetical protein